MSRRPACRRRPVVRVLAALVALVAAVAGCMSAGGPPGATPRITPGTDGAPREVNVIAKEWTYVPGVVDLVPGETVLLHLVNGGTEPHEWVIGGASVQAAWAAAEDAVEGAPPGPTPAVSVAPDIDARGLRVSAASGARVDVAWTVPVAGPEPGWLVACHIPGHFEQGMAVPVRWVGRDGLPLASGGVPSASP